MWRGARKTNTEQRIKFHRVKSRKTKTQETKTEN